MFDSDNDDIDYDLIRRQFAFHERERDRLRNVIEVANREGVAHRMISEGLLTLYPFLKQPEQLKQADTQLTEPDVPKGIEALRQVMESQPERFLTAVEVHKAMVDVNWVDGGENSAAGVRAALNRAVKLHLVAKRQRDGRTMEYCWTGSSAVAAPRETPAGWTPDVWEYTTTVVSNLSIEHPVDSSEEV